MTEQAQCAAGPRKRWHIGSYAFEHYENGRWGCCYRNSRGVGNCRNPVAAFFALHRWLRRPAGPPGND